MPVQIDYVMISGLRADYKRQKVVITLECAISKDVMTQIPLISSWAAYDQPVSLELSKIQQEMPWSVSNGATGGGEIDVEEAK